MARLFGLSQGQVAGIRPLLSKERVVKRVDARKVLSGILYVTRRGLCGWMLRQPMAPTKPSTTVAAAAQTQTRIFLI